MSSVCRGEDGPARPVMKPQTATSAMASVVSAVKVRQPYIAPAASMQTVALMLKALTAACGHAALERAAAPAPTINARPNEMPGKSARSVQPKAVRARRKGRQPKRHSVGERCGESH